MKKNKFTMFGILGSYISKSCRHNGKKDHTLFNTAHGLLYKNPYPAMLLNPEGTIILANAAACEQLGRTEADLCAMAFDDLCIEGNPAIPPSYGPSHYLMRDGAPPLPVTYKTADIQLPNAALSLTEKEDDSVQTLAFLTFTDISRALELDHQLERVERITEATRLAAEMAHEIRTPLTSISASVQLLKHYEERSTSADWLPDSPRRRDRKELFTHLDDASQQLDHVIQNFLDFAEFSPEDLLSIIKLDSIDKNQGYIGHLNTIGRGRGFTNGQNSDCGRRSNDSQLIE